MIDNRHIEMWRSQFGDHWNSPVIDANASAIITVPFGGDNWQVYVRRIDDDALRLIAESRPPEAWVHLWWVDSIERIGEIAAETIVLTTTDHFDLSPLYRLHPGVRRLVLNGLPDDGEKVRLARLGSLVRIGLEWDLADVSEGLGELRKATFSEFSARSIDVLPPSDRLQHLNLYNARRLASFDGLGRFPGLERVEIHGARLVRDPTPLTELACLKSVELDGCRSIGSLDWVARCRGLVELGVMNWGSIASLSPIRDHPALETLWAWEDTTIEDGDLGPLLQVPRLRQLAMANRRSYRPSVSAIKDELARRQGGPSATGG